RPGQLTKHRSVRRVRRLLPLVEREGPLVFLPSYDTKNYFHFVTDALTRLYAFSDDGRADLARFRENVAHLEFVLDEAGPAWQRQFGDLLGLRHTTARLTDDTNWRVRRLVFPTFVGVQHPRFGASLFPREML